MEKEIKGFEKYTVTDRGRVISKGVELKKYRDYSPNGTHYECVYLYSGTPSKRRYRSVHRLVAEAFIPNPENKPQVNHIDGDKTNNSLDNLEWATQEENMQHAISLGLINRESNHNNRLSKGVMCSDKDGNKIKDFPSAREAVRQGFALSASNLSATLCGKRPTHNNYYWSFN